mmetsp:Transcript_45407/g.78466  ORF Transcript_45407/g.78466 Transcript_45407/m.78466 type:complete len:116 (+) Transcript_45407:616-963(+)
MKDIGKIMQLELGKSRNSPKLVSLINARESRKKKRREFSFTRSRKCCTFPRHFHDIQNLKTKKRKEKMILNVMYLKKEGKKFHQPPAASSTISSSRQQQYNSRHQRKQPPPAVVV